jgi:dipeptidyl-peptidase-4
MALESKPTEVFRDRACYPYPARVRWSAVGAPRDSGTTRLVRADDHHIGLIFSAGYRPGRPPGSSSVSPTRVLAVGERPLTGPRLRVRAVLDLADPDVLVSEPAGEAAEDPETGQTHVYRVHEPGAERVTREPGAHSAVRLGASP